MAIRPALSYPGGKWKALPQILPLIPENIEHWYESFFGGGSVTLGYMQSNKCSAKTFTVCEISPEIWAFWQGVKESAAEAAYIAKEWFKRDAPTQIRLSTMDPTDPDYEKVETQAIAEGEALWKQLTTIDCSQLTLAQRAARTFIVNKISFSGMGDSGSMSKDQFKDFRLEKADRMIELQPLLQKIEIRMVSFEELIEEASTRPETSFMFLDPPYIAQEKSGLYGKDGDTHHGFPHEKLAKMCKEAKFPWLMTLDDSVKARKLYRGMYIRPFRIPYTLAGKTAEDALAGEEIFIANYNILPDNSYDYIGEI